MNRLIMLAALMLSVIGGLTIMLGSSPLAAQSASATRAFDSSSVTPGGTVTVTITLEGTDALATVTEMLPASFAYGSSSLDASQVRQSGQSVTFVPLGGTSFTYTATAPDTEGSGEFSGTLNIGGGNNVAVRGDNTVEVSTTPAPTGPAVTPADGLDFDIVSAKAVKGARVSGVGNPIATNALEWVVADTGFTLMNFPDGGVVDGDYRVKSTGSGKFGLYVEESGAGAQSISVDLTYTNADGDELTSTLEGDVTAQADLDAADSFEFKVPQNVASGTPIGSFDVSGKLDDEALDGIITGADAAPFAVNDADMTIYRKNGADLTVKNYTFDLTINGDAGLAARADRATVTIIVTASNDKHDAPDTFTATIYENIKGAGLVSIDTAVGDASAGISNPDGDKLTYSLSGTSSFEIDSDSGAITVGPNAIGDGMDGDHTFTITVSDGVTANDEDIAATVTVDANDPVTAKSDGLPSGVTHSAPVTYTVTTPEVAGTVNGYHILDVSDLVNLDLDADGETETPTYTPSVRTAPLNVDAAGRLLLTHVPRGFQDGVDDEALPSIEVEIDDGYNPSITITIDVVLNVKERPDQITPSLAASIDENKTGAVQAALSDLDASGNATLGRLIALISEVESDGDGVEYKHTGGTNGGEPGAGAIFSVDSDTGAISLGTAQDADTLTAMPSVVLQVERDSDGADLGVVFVAITINNVNEAPEFMADAPGYLNVEENAQPGTMVGDAIMADDQDGDNIAFSIKESGTPFSIDSDGQISVSGALDLTASPYSVTLVATDDGSPVMMTEHALMITVGDVNDPPKFDQPAQTTASIYENASAGTVVATYNATDADGSDMLEGIHYELRDADDLKNFDIMTETVGGQIMGKLVVKDGANLDVDADGAATSYTVEVNVKDADDADSELVIEISVMDVNDNAPMFATDNSVIITVVENAARGTALTSGIASGGMYVASDADLTAPNNTVTYSIDSKSFHIDPSTGLLTVLESLDADSNTPCGATGCQFKITAMDSGNPSMSDTLDVTVNVSNAEDSVSTFKISKANPVPGVSMGNPDSALADTKTGGDEYLWNLLDCAGMLDLVNSTDTGTYCKMWDGMSAAAMAAVSAAFDSANESAPYESPYDQPATYGSAPMNFVEADWANWGTVVRVEVTAESPDDECGNGNQCVYIDVESDSAGNELRLAAYRSAMQENRFITAVMLVEDNPTDDGDGEDGDRNNPVYKDASGGVVRLETDEEDEVSFRLVGSTAPPITVDVENELPEFNNFMPEHEAAFDDGDVEYTFTITDTVSGIPEPEDLADDTNGDRDYMPLVALISSSQCHSENPNDKAYSMHNFAGNSLWCKSAPSIRQVVDDRDFDEIDDGFEVSTKVVLDENVVRYVTFIVCDNAGNCAMYTPDQNDTDEALAQITIDTVDPKLVEARTGIKWDDIDEELDDNNKTWIQVIFEDLSPLDEDTVETDDFVVEGHTVKDVKTYGDDADEGEGAKTRRMVFIELEDELAPDETPDVTLVPNGIADKAGNEQDDGEAEAKDYIAPSFTVVSIVAPRTPEGESDQLAGDDDEVVITITSDERIVETRPSVTVSYVNAPSGSVYTKVGTADTCDDEGNDDGKRVRGEIVNNDNCQDSDAADGSALGTTIQKISNTEWIVTVDEPESTGYYNIYISGHDRSSQRNEGDEGVKPAEIVTDFFERDGDVNSDDAHYFQGDVNLSNPGVRVSGVQVEDTEPTVEFKSPLFVELDFTRPYISDCASDADKDERDANCYAESDEYAKDSYDSVTVTSFTLNGTDITDSVKTTDNETFLVSLEGIAIGDHEIEIQAMDQAGNELDKALSVEFEVEERDDFTKRLSPGWNLVSIPGEPADSDISVVFGSDVEVRTIYTYDPVIPGGWMVAVRETLDSDWQGDLTDITARRGYWVLSDAIQDWDVSIPRIAGGAVGTGTPIQPPVIALYAGWNLVPVIDVTGDFAGDGISAQTYLQSLDDGLDLARVLGFDTITNSWSTIMAPESGDSGTLEYGRAYWVFVRQAGSLVPGGD